MKPVMVGEQHGEEWRTRAETRETLLQQFSVTALLLQVGLG